MAKCSNCKANLSCGCQKRKAKDGTSTCSKCLASYEASLVQKNTIVEVSQTDQNVWGANRYKKG